MKNPGTTTKLMMDRKVIGSTQHSFMKGLAFIKVGLTNLIAKTLSVDEGLGVGVVYLGFQKALRTISHHILILKLMDMDQISG